MELLYFESIALFIWDYVTLNLPVCKKIIHYGLRFYLHYAYYKLKYVKPFAGSLLFFLQSMNCLPSLCFIPSRAASGEQRRLLLCVVT